LKKKFLERLDGIAAYADKCGHHIGVGNLTLTSIKWNYEKALHVHYLTCWKGRTFDLLEPINEKMLQMLEKQCGSLDQLAQLYEAMEFKENMISCMVLKFQIQHFSRYYEVASQTKEKILEVINSFEFEGLKKEYASIFKNGTAHEKFVEKYTLHMNRIQDFTSENGIDCYRMLSDDQMHSKSEWSIKNFLELDFSILPDKDIQENQKIKKS